MNKRSINEIVSQLRSGQDNDGSSISKQNWETFSRNSNVDFTNVDIQNIFEKDVIDFNDVISIINSVSINDTIKINQPLTSILDYNSVIIDPFKNESDYYKNAINNYGDLLFYKVRDKSELFLVLSNDFYNEALMNDNISIERDNKSIFSIFASRRYIFNGTVRKS